MEIRKVSVGQIKMAAYNPNEMTPEELERLKKSITTFGYVEPVVWNSRSGTLVGGHQRMKVLQELGRDEVEAVVVDLDDAQEKALNIALNKNRGEFDKEKLAALIDELVRIPEIDLSASGFDQLEIDKVLDHLSISPDETFDLRADLEKIGEPVTKRGDVIELGPHRLICGDSSDISCLEKLMNGQKAEMVFSDLPYNVSYDAASRPDSAGAHKTKWRPIINDNMPQEEYVKLLKAVFVNLKEVIKPGTPVYAWTGFRQFGQLCDILIANGYHPSCVINWIKPCPCPSFADYSMATEYCVYCWDNRAPHRWYGEGYQSNVWEVGRETELLHPTLKPQELIARAITNSSRRSDIVFDGFSGSGSVLICCENLERNCYAVELDEYYCDVAVRRFIKLAPGKVSEDIRQKYELIGHQYE